MDVLDDIQPAGPGASSKSSRQESTVPPETEPADGGGSAAHAMSGLIAVATLGMLAVALLRGLRRR
jgi:hypothetical protein